MFGKLLTLCTLGSLPVVSAAQTTPTPARYYVGLGAAVQRVSAFSDYGYTQAGPALVVGRQLTPRVALQASVAATYGGERQYYEWTYRQLSVTTTSLLLRYTATNPAARLQLDGVAGATLFTRGLFREGGPSSQYALTLGPTARYALRPQLALTATLPVSYTLGQQEASLLSDHLTTTLLVGAQYTFGR